MKHVQSVPRHLIWPLALLIPSNLMVLKKKVTNAYVFIGLFNFIIDRFKIEVLILLKNMLFALKKKAQEQDTILMNTFSQTDCNLRMI